MGPSSHSPAFTKPLRKSDMADLNALTQANAARWAKAKLTREVEFAAPARRLVAAKDRYIAISRKTGVPWWVIAVIHERESRQDFSCNLANGEPFNRVTRLVPKGKGPWKSFEDAACDALVNFPPYAAKWKDWSVPGALTLLEQYNGLGYANGPRDVKGNKYPPQPSPYIWSGTDQYVAGKYVVDGIYDPKVVDKQLGCAGLLIAMRRHDDSVFLPTPKPSVWQQFWEFLTGGKAK